MKISTFAALLIAAVGFGLTGCTTAPETEGKREMLDINVRDTLKDMRAESPDFGDFLDTRAYAYAIYPTVGEGGLIVGGASGRGEVFEKGEKIGYSRISKATI